MDETPEKMPFSCQPGDTLRITWAKPRGQRLNISTPDGLVVSIELHPGSVVDIRCGRSDVNIEMLPSEGGEAGLRIVED